MIKKYNIVVNGNSYEVQVEELGTEVSTVQIPQKQTQVAKPVPRPSTQNQTQQPQVTSAGGGSINAPKCISLL